MEGLVRNNSWCTALIQRGGGNVTATMGIKANLSAGMAVFMFLGLGVFAVALAKLFNLVRSKVYKDKNNLDTDFDAGGKVSMGLTATTIVSQWTWAATLLQSSTTASKYGISGPFWYAAGATIQILLFSMLSVQLKVRAPGAKTFLQVVRARFGARPHIVFCGFALLTNTVVTAMLMLGGAAVITNMVNDLSVEMATGLVAMVIGSFTFIGGLGATFYVSYINTALVFVIMIIFLVKVYHDPADPHNPLGSVEEVYAYINCSLGPEGNMERSYLTIFSNSGLMFGIINIVGNFGTVFVDQSYWQSSVAARPRQGVWGFLSGGLTWFAVPFTFASTMGLAYIALSARQGAPLLSDHDVNSGLVPPVVAQRLMGDTGEVLVVLLILMAITSTGSAEVIAVTSILVYDIYQLYLKPYRAMNDVNSCILCGRQRGRMANPRDKCKCISMTFCANCAADDDVRESSKRAIKPTYKCPTHGPYRTYMDYLGQLKNWCLLVVVILIIPLTLILNITTVSLGWVYLFMGVMIGSAVVPITLCMCWERLTGLGMIVGALGGTAIGFIVWLGLAAIQPGGLAAFMESTGSEVAMLGGNVASIMSGAVITVVVSLVSGWNGPVISKEEVWENTRDIDNPLSPWTELYARDLNLTGANKLDNRPSLEEVASAFRGAKLAANIGALSLTFILIIVWPAGMMAAGIFDLTTFTHWINVSQTWGFLAAVFILVVPVVNELWEIRLVLSENKKIHADNFPPNGSRATFTSSTQKVAPGNSNSRDPSQGTLKLTSPPQGEHSGTVRQDIEASGSQASDPREPVF